MTLLPTRQCAIDKVYAYVDDEWKDILRDALQVFVRKQQVINEITFYGIKMCKFTPSECETLNTKYYFHIDNKMTDNGYFILRNPIAKICNENGVKYTIADIHEFREKRAQGNNIEKQNREALNKLALGTSNGINDSNSNANDKMNGNRSGNGNGKNKRRGTKRKQFEPLNMNMNINGNRNLNGNDDIFQFEFLNSNAAKKRRLSNKNSKIGKIGKKNKNKSKSKSKSKSGSVSGNNISPTKDALHRFSKLSYPYKPIAEQKVESAHEYLYCWVEEANPIKSCKGQRE